MDKVKSPSDDIENRRTLRRGDAERRHRAGVCAVGHEQELIPATVRGEQPQGSHSGRAGPKRRAGSTADDEQSAAELEVDSAGVRPNVPGVANAEAKDERRVDPHAARCDRLEPQPGETDTRPDDGRVAEDRQLPEAGRPEALHRERDRVPAAPHAPVLENIYEARLVDEPDVRRMYTMIRPDLARRHAYPAVHPLAQGQPSVAASTYT
jgi:hypothetical protein